LTQYHIDLKTILDTLDAGTQWLEKRGIENARQNIQWLVCRQLGLSRIQLYTSFDEIIAEEDLIILRGHLKRRANGEPLQHILGTVEFYRQEFKSDARALIPRPETEELVELVLNQFSSKLTSDSKVLDLGTGSGVLGLSIASALKEHQVQVTCADLSLEALSLAKENAEKLDITNVTFQQTHLFSAIEDQYDLIVANLPYIPERDRASLKKEVTFDPELALFSGQDGLTLLRQFCQEASRYLTPTGSIALEIGIHQHEEIKRLLSENGFYQIECYKDLSGIPRFPIASLSPIPIQAPIHSNP